MNPLPIFSLNTSARALLIWRRPGKTIRSFSGNGSCQAKWRETARMRAASGLSSSGAPRGSNRANLRNCITVRVMTKQQRVYLLAGWSLVDLARRNGTPFLYFSTVAFWKANVSQSKRKSDPAALPAVRATATKTPSCQTPADVCQLLGITSRTRRSGRGFGFGETPDAAKFFVPPG